MKVYLYESTGFDGVNRPDCLELVMKNFTPAHTYDDIDIVQVENLAYITLSGLTHDIARAVDYVIVDNTDEDTRNVYPWRGKYGYFVNSFQLEQLDVCRFELQVDGIASIGGFGDNDGHGVNSGNLIIAASANRMTVSKTEDNSKFFTLDEPFQPSERLEMSSGLMNLTETSETSGSTTIAETLTCPPRTVAPKVKEGSQTIGSITVNNDTNAKQAMEGQIVGDNLQTQQQTQGSTTSFGFTYSKLIVPKTRQFISTILGFNRPDGSGQASVYPGTIWWNYNNIDYNITLEGKAYKGTMLQDLHDCGRDADVLGIWEVPNEYINPGTDRGYSPTKDTSTSSFGMGIGNAVNRLQNITSKTFTTKTAYNNKAKYSQNVILKVYSPVSGESIDKYLYEICDSTAAPNLNNIPCSAVITADIRSNGHPIFMWKTMNGIALSGMFPESIKGGPWRTISVGMEGMSGMNNRLYELDARHGEGAVAGVARGFDTLAAIPDALGIKRGSAIGNALGYVGGEDSPIGNVLRRFQKWVNNPAIREQEDLLNKQSINASTKIQIGNSNFARECGLNKFYFILSSYSTNDTAAYDTFLTRFGYNVGNKPFTNVDLYTRNAFNYIRANDLTIESVNNNIGLVQICIEDFKRGVRIWHKKPEYTDLLASGNQNEYVGPTERS